MPPIKTLSSLANPLVKHLVKLKEDKQLREQTKSVVIFGKKLVKELCQHKPALALFISDPSYLSLPILTQETFLVTNEIIRKISKESASEGILALVSLPSLPLPSTLSSLVVFDRLQDPGNLGTCLRAAVAFKWEAAFLLEGTVDPFNDKALRAAKGATFKLPLIQGDVKRLYTLIHTFRLTPFSADLQGTPLHQVSPQKNPLLILGNESRGISAELKNLSQPLTIPMPGPMESLNVSLAAAIMMYHLKPPLNKGEPL